jgi:hypothetical protein
LALLSPYLDEFFPVAMVSKMMSAMVIFKFSLTARQMTKEELMP